MSNSITKPKPEWNVFIENINGKRIEIYNVFKHYSFMCCCDEAWNKYKNDFSKFEKSVQQDLTYYFWSKCEWEIVISDFPPSNQFKKRKVDVHEQIMMNWDKFIDYLWRYYKANYNDHCV